MEILLAVRRWDDGHLQLPHLFGWTVPVVDDPRHPGEFRYGIARATDRIILGGTRCRINCDYHR